MCSHPIGSVKQVLIVDTETTGLSPQDGVCIEVGAILFDVAARASIASLSFLMPSETNAAQHVNGIDPELTFCSPCGRSLLVDFADEADAIVAHNVAFDRQWFDGVRLPDLGKPWICTMDDVPWQPSLRLKGRPSVTALALAHGVPVWAAHRALTDCIYLAQVFERCEDLPMLLEAAMQPRHEYRALVGYDDRQLAKDAGFSWVKERKAWVRKMTEAEVRSLGFKVELVSHPSLF